jgi:hypothetical protein
MHGFRESRNGRSTNRQDWLTGVRMSNQTIDRPFGPVPSLRCGPEAITGVRGSQPRTAPIIRRLAGAVVAMTNRMRHSIVPKPSVVLIFVKYDQVLGSRRKTRSHARWICRSLDDRQPGYPT